MVKKYAYAGVTMKTQMWIRLQVFNPTNACETDCKSYKHIAIHGYDELIEWMSRNAEMWQLVNVETDYICNANNPKDNVNVRNLYYVFE